MSKDISFRFCDPAAYYLLLFGGMACTGLISFFLCRYIVLYIVPSGSDGDAATSSSPLPFILVLTAIAVILSLSLSYAIANKATDRRGVAKFYESHVTFHFGRKEVSVYYLDIEDIQCHMAYDSLKNGYLYKISIVTHLNYVPIQIPRREQRQCRQYHTDPQLEPVLVELTQCASFI